VSTLARQVRVEWRKVVTTRTVWGLLGGFLLWTAVNVVAQVFAGDQAASAQVPALDSPEGIRNVFASSSSAAVFTLLLGVIAVTSEFRHGTAVGTFMAVPRRGWVIAAKAVALPCVAFVYAVLGAALTVLLAVPLLTWKGVDVDLTAGDVPRVLAGCVAAVTVYAVLGVGFGSLLRNQVAAVVVALVWVLLADSLLVSFLPEVGRWLPGGAAAAMTLGQPMRGGPLLGQAAGAALLLGYGVALSILGASTTIRRDVT
jgi:ABC-2 type transport system permease protein